MSLYLDASVLVSLFLRDTHTDRAAAMVAAVGSEAIVSDFARAEFAAVMGRLQRTGELTTPAISTVFSIFDEWTAVVPRKVAVLGIDITDTEAILRRLDLGLRAPDALHIAIVRRIGATLATFDNRMADAARALALRVA